MSASIRLSDIEYEILSLEYEKNPPELSGNSGFLTNLREQLLVTELLSPNYARSVRHRGICGYKQKKAK